ncbi:AraC family transcriptional regulator [Dermacoccus sp. Tok2021]|uniref:AraC family transcriptional regulator n=1 Tax=Dermacoccus sp. Tok2021 TaxID=2826873 RepID=UPI001CA6F7E7|nr:AraC family transcriptional regulator [Dermacoccus sp. Tok2021]MBZ4498615.1 AraC family transcriptional regulator [Dermacoccus sp. Tok2021]
MPDGPELSALASALGPAVLELVDHLPGTMFCVKGADGRYIAVNPTFVKRTNKRSRAEVLGRRAGELFVAELADRYEEQDARVHSSGRPLFNELELIRAPGGPFRWHVTAKVPLRDEDGRVTGVVSMSQDVGEGAADDRTMTSLGAVVAHIRAHLGENVTSQDLARVAGCSVDTLERRCRRVFGRSPGQLILSTRIDVARGLLTGSDMPLAQIADLCGYADQAGFSRTFTRLVGIPPGRYRKSM